MNLLTSPALGASFIALTVFFLIVFASNSILSSATIRTLGIIVTLSIISFLFIIIAIIFFL